MPFIESALQEESLAGGVSAMPSPISGVNAHLRLIPRYPSDFRVVAPFYHADGSLCEAELTPFEAAGLMSDIARVIDQGNSHGPHGTRDTKRGAPDER